MLSFRVNVLTTYARAEVKNLQKVVMISSMDIVSLTHREILREAESVSATYRPPRKGGELMTILKTGSSRRGVLKGGPCRNSRHRRRAADLHVAAPTPTPTSRPAARSSLASTCRRQARTPPRARTNCSPSSLPSNTSMVKATAACSTPSAPRCSREMASWARRSSTSPATRRPSRTRRGRRPSR